MDVEKQPAVTSSCPSQSRSSTSSPDVMPPENLADSPTHHATRLGTVIPNRIFVGGFDYKVNESDLQHFFSQYGSVKEVKIVLDRAGISKGYGFVTFETQEDALKILHDPNGISFKDKKLSIGQAVRKQQPPGLIKSFFMGSHDPAVPLLMSCGALCLSTSAGSPYTYHNGVAYFHGPSGNPAGHHWPPALPMMLPQSHRPIYQPPACHHCQCVPNQWTVVRSPLPSSLVVFPQQSEYLYQLAEAGSVQPPLPVMEDAAPEFVEPTVPQVYPGLAPFVLQQDPGKNLMFPQPRVQLKPKYR